MDNLVSLVVADQSVLVARIDALGVDVGRLPYTLRILLENVVRATALGIGGAQEVGAIAAWEPSAEPRNEISFRPSRVLLQRTRRSRTRNRLGHRSSPASNSPGKLTSRLPLSSLDPTDYR